MAPLSEEDYMMRHHEVIMKRQNALHQTELLHREEESRRSELYVLQLQDKNNGLRDQMFQQHAEMLQITEDGIRLRTDLVRAQTTAQDQQRELRKKAVELKALKAESGNMNSSFHESAKTIQEKITLTRNLARLESEIAQLHSQLIGYQAVVADRNDLRRQLDSLEVEVENNKRAKQNSLTDAESRIVLELRAHIRNAQQCLTQEKKERELLRMKFEKEATEEASRYDEVSELVAQLKEKLQGSQAELRQVLSEQQERKVGQEKASIGDYARGKGDQEMPRKQQHQTMSRDGMASIGTPGQDELKQKRVGKGRAPEQGTINAKSMFSITPFLDRTKVDIDESSIASTLIANPVGITGNTLSEEHISQLSELDGFTDQPAKSRTRKHTNNSDLLRPPNFVGIAVSKGERDKTQPKTLAVMRTSERNKVQVASQSDHCRPSLQVASTHDEGSQVEEPQPKHVRPSDVMIQSEQAIITALQTSSTLTGIDGRKKKRKLIGGEGGKNMFEEDGEGLVKRQSRPQLGHKGILKTKLNTGKGVLPTGGFSPLKRERRGVGASFLA